MEAKCKKCGVTALIVRVESAGTSFVMKPGLALADLCPVIIDRTKAGKTPLTEDECPNLQAAIDARIEQLKKEHS